MDNLAIINHALLLIGEPALAGEDATGSTARRAFAAYPIIRDGLLRSYRWNFAMKRATLAADPTPPAFGYANRFALPADMLHFVGLFDNREPAHNLSSSRESYRIEAGFLLYDGDAPSIYYVAKQDNATTFDGLFVEACAAKLAARLAYNITGSSTHAERLEALFEENVRKARMANAIEQPPEISQTTDWLDSRYTGTNTTSYWRGFPGGIA
jgi:hypothetical protein